MNIIVTGGSRGIGRAIVKRLLADGHKVCFSYHSRKEEADKLIQEAEAEGFGGKVLGVKADSGSGEDCQRLAAEAEAFFGDKVWGLVNNAGINRDTLMLRMDEEDFNAVLRTDLTGPFLMAKAVLPSLMKLRQGRIVNMSSVIGLYGNAGQANYAAAKAGLIGLTRTMAKEFASRNILVNAVAPGMVETDMTAAMNDKAKEAALGQIALKRMAKPEEIASAVSFLLSEDSSYITGQVLEVSGGMVL